MTRPSERSRKRGGVKEEKGGRGRQPPLLAAPRRRFHQRRGIPLREMQAVAPEFQPALQQIELRAFAGTVGPFYNNQRTGIGAARHPPPPLRQCGFRGFRAGLLLFHVLVFHQTLRAKRRASPAYFQFVTRVLQHTTTSPAKRQAYAQKTVILKCKNFFGFCRKSPIKSRISPIIPVKLS